MARRILSAEPALTPNTQAPLGDAGKISVRTENPNGDGLVPGLETRWRMAGASSKAPALFDWADRSALLNEIDFVNRAREKLDEAAVKIAPAMLRIVLTVKANVAGPREQRAFLTSHLDWDFRRVSELCLVAERYGLLEPQRRAAGTRELKRYGWSNALKLAHVPVPADREDIWERACDGNPKASYRDVLEEIRRFRERKLIGPPIPAEVVGDRLASLRGHLQALEALQGGLETAEGCQAALREVARVQKELARLKKALRERMESADLEALAAIA